MCRELRALVSVSRSVCVLVASTLFAWGANVQIDLFDTYRFHQHIAVRVGDDVTWIGRSRSGAHIVESFDGLFKSDPLNEVRPNFTFAFDVPGIYYYRVLSFPGSPPYDTVSPPWRDLGSVQVYPRSDPLPVLIHYPLPGAHFGRTERPEIPGVWNERILIIASATNAPGQIQRVEFYSSEQLIGAADQAPYRFFWTNAALGMHVLTARSFDVDGSVHVSPPVPLSILNLSSPRSVSAELLPGGLFMFDYVLPGLLGGNGFFVHISEDASQLGLEIKNAAVSGRYVISMDTNQMQFFRVKERF